MNKLLIYYSFVISNIIVFAGFASASNLSQLLSAILFYPLGFFFLLLVLPRNRRALTLPGTQRLSRHPKSGRRHPPARQPELSLLALSKDFYPQTATAPVPSVPLDLNIEQPLEIINRPQDLASTLSRFSSSGSLDTDRRQFIKLIGSAGVSVFMLSLFTKRAQAAFFGSVPGPGTVALKDPATGLQITPAQTHPTDGYRISQVDDSVPAYYGFIDKTGAWFIMREQSDGSYRYTRGATDFSDSWTSRASLTYNTFDIVF